MSIEAMKQALEALDYDSETGLFTWNNLAVPRMRGKRAGTITAEGRTHIKLGKRSYFAHRLAWLKHYGKWPDYVIDHINGYPNDNRISNLRDVPRPINMQNQRTARSDSKSGLLGVTKSGNKWQSMIRLHGKAKYLGLFETPELAHQAYVAAKREMHIGGTL